jgi:hypothetical protein
MTTRGDRRYSTGKVIGKRAAVAKRYQAGDDLQTHRFHKNDPAGHCGNKGCSICVREREWKRLAKKRERREGKLRERAETWPRCHCAACRPDVYDG